jgi:hypothetical protein
MNGLASQYKESIHLSLCLVCDKDGVINVCVWLYSNDDPVI